MSVIRSDRLRPFSQFSDEIERPHHSAVSASLGFNLFAIMDAMAGQKVMQRACGNQPDHALGLGPLLGPQVGFAIVSHDGSNDIPCQRGLSDRKIEH